MNACTEFSVRSNIGPQLCQSCDYFLLRFFNAYGVGLRRNRDNFPGSQILNDMLTLINGFRDLGYKVEV